VRTPTRGEQASNKVPFWLTGSIQSGITQVYAGTLGGTGIIAGATTIGTGTGTGAFLAPAAGMNVQATLTTQSALTFNADATYTYTFRAKRNRARTDKLIANGVIINSGAMIALSGQTQGALSLGLVLTLISNTSANPISGIFGNLPDGGIVTINGNNFQASYSGGDGNAVIGTRLQSHRHPRRAEEDGYNALSCAGARSHRRTERSRCRKWEMTRLRCLPRDEGVAST
jgi:hypothetical protein